MPSKSCPLVRSEIAALAANFALQIDGHKQAQRAIASPQAVTIPNPSAEDVARLLSSGWVREASRCVDSECGFWDDLCGCCRAVAGFGARGE